MARGVRVIPSKTLRFVPFQMIHKVARAAVCLSSAGRRESNLQRTQQPPMQTPAAVELKEKGSVREGF
jgi:hypothetical protein